VTGFGSSYLTVADHKASVNLSVLELQQLILSDVKVRRFFKGFGSSDGEIVAFLPPDKNEGQS
jgi:hypothetical protein